MLRKPLKLPVRLACILAVLLLCVLAVLSALLPILIKLLCEMRASLRPDLPALSRIEEGLLLALAYVMVLVAAGAILFLIRLLRAISRGRVFSESTVHHLLAVSLCCFFEALLFLGTAVWFHSSLVGMGIFAFIGLCLLTVRNVMSEACRIKAENDFTI